MTRQPPAPQKPRQHDVCAVLYGPAPEPLVVEAEQAAAQAAVAPAQVLRAPELAAAVQAAGASQRRWMWLLEAGTVPATDALEALLAVAGEDPHPVLVASKLVDRRGELRVDCTLRHEVFEKEHSVEAAARSLVQLRTAAHGSVLVSNDTWVRCGGPRRDIPPALAMFEWSARLLRRWQDTGYLVPASLAVRHLEPGPGPDWRGRLRLLSGAAWTPTEKLWEGFLISQALGAGVSARVRGGPGSAPPDAGHRAGHGG